MLVRTAVAFIASAGKKQGKSIKADKRVSCPHSVQGESENRCYLPFQLLERNLSELGFVHRDVS